MVQLIQTDADPGEPAHPFHDLVFEIAEQRRVLEQWQAFEPVYQQAVAGRLQPLVDRLRAGRISLVALLDRAWHDPALAKRFRKPLRAVLLAELTDLLDEAPDPALQALQSYHAEPTAAARASASAARDAGRAASSEDDPQAIADAAEAAWQARADHAQAGRDSRRARRKGRQAAAAEAQQSQTEQQALASLREVYRRLAMALHPDRETDDALRARKNELMREVNQAYAARDLLTLLELQLRIAQIDQTTLARLSDERLAAYRYVLRDQLARLRDEVRKLQAPYLAAMPGVAPARLTPERVMRALEDDIRDVRAAVAELESDLLDFRDLSTLERRLARR